MKKNALLIPALVAALLFANQISANEFIIKPLTLIAGPGQSVPFQVMSSAVFMVSQEIEPPGLVGVRVIEEGENEPRDVSLQENTTLRTLDGAFVPKKIGTAVIYGHRSPAVWTRTSKGWFPRGKRGLSDVQSSGRYEKYAKALVKIGGASEGFDRVVGHRLEIVPVDNPLKAVPGDELEFKILFEGRTLLSVPVYATYDGFSSSPDTYAFFRQPQGGLPVKVKITRPGTWMVRIEHRLPGNEDFDNDFIRATLVFRVD